MSSEECWGAFMKLFGETVEKIGELTSNFSIKAFWESVSNFISDLSIEEITLISILVTLIIFYIGNRSEVKFKKLESRREEYKKFITVLEKVYTNKIELNEETKKEFFEVGSSLLIYGSKRVYKKYLFFREYTTNPLIVKSRYNDNSISLYVVADILKTIRHEVGMTRFGELESNEVLSFFVNDIGINPYARVNSYKARYKIFMIKAELFAINAYQAVFLKKIFYYIIKPIFGLVWLLIKFVVLLPLFKLLGLIFPKLRDKIPNIKDEESVS